MARRVLIVGTGLIGGSVGLALRAAGDSYVTGSDRDPSHAQRAAEIGALDATASDLSTACRDADVIVVATPVGQVVPTVAAIAATAPDATVVTDVGSAKAPIVAEAERLLGPRRPFVGGHPMAGTEGEGIDAARADLFDGALWILTPTATTDPGAFRTVNSLVASIGARTLALDPQIHDRLVALVSHLPYAVSTALADLAGEEGDERVFQAAAGTFRDVTRTAGSNPAMWRDILAANREAVLRELDAFGARLGSFRDALAAQDWDTVDATIARARRARDRFPLKGERGPSDPVMIEVPVPDRAGVLASITTTLGDGGINIEDLSMEHTPAGGMVRLVVDGHDLAGRAAERLRAHGFSPTIVEAR